MPGEPDWIQGGCLCGTVRYEVARQFRMLYFCHCSKCRRFTGSGNSSLLATRIDNLRWISGTEHLHEFAAPSGYYAVSCSRCGSPMPKQRWGKIYLVPAGSLDAEPEVERSVHMHCNSKAAWRVIPDSAEKFAEEPP